MNSERETKKIVDEGKASQMRVSPRNVGLRAARAKRIVDYFNLGREEKDGDATFTKTSKGTGLGSSPKSK